MLRSFEVGVLVLALSRASATVAKPIILIDSPPPGIVSFDFAFHLNLTLGGSKIADNDRARAASKLAGLGRRDGAIAATNTAVTYVANIGIGEPATNYSLVIDTGSADKKYTLTSSSVNTGKNVSVSYGSGSFDGLEYNDTVTLSPELVIKQQSIGVANRTNGFDGYDGILGLGPMAISANTVDNMTTVPTVMNNLFVQGKISSELLAVSFAPTTTEPNGNGVLTFGGIDESKCTGDIHYVPVTTTSPARNYWGIDQSVTYGSSKKQILKSGSGIVDTGSTLVLLSSDAYAAYTNATGATIDAATGLLKIESSDYDKLESLYFEIGDTVFEMIKNAQKFPSALNEFIGGEKDAIYLVIGDLGVDSGSGLDFINGYAFLERFYSVYDTTNQRIGLATTANTNSTAN